MVLLVYIGSLGCSVLVTHIPMAFLPTLGGSFSARPPPLVVVFRWHPGIAVSRPLARSFWTSALARSLRCRTWRHFENHGMLRFSRVTVVGALLMLARLLLNFFWALFLLLAPAKLLICWCLTLCGSVDRLLFLRGSLRCPVKAGLARFSRGLHRSLSGTVHHCTANECQFPSQGLYSLRFRFFGSRPCFSKTTQEIDCHLAVLSCNANH